MQRKSHFPKEFWKSFLYKGNFLLFFPSTMKMVTGVQIHSYTENLERFRSPERDIGYPILGLIIVH